MEANNTAASSKKANLAAAKRNKNDEFYTQLADIEKELYYYRDHFKGKTVYCNCDDPRVSNFFKYFWLNFKFLGLKKLIATSYKSMNAGERTIQDSDKGLVLVYEGESDDSNMPRESSIVVTELRGDGDFRSDESIEFLKESDIVVTNPPFSLFREYVAQLMEYDKAFVLLGTVNAVTYKEIFPLIKENRMFSGTRFNKVMEFGVPSHYPLTGSRVRVDDKGNRFVSVPGIAWYTNMDIPKRHDDLILYRSYNSVDYPKYDNYDAINVDKVKDIPEDYAGVMGVPITFLDKYNPDQFEILGMTKTPICYTNARLAERLKLYENVVQHNKNGNVSSGNKVNDGPVLIVSTAPVNTTYYTIDGLDGYMVALYARVLIRNKHPKKSGSLVD